MDRLQGRRLDGRYELLGRIGTGGMANVYKATDLKDNTTVAVKVLREEFLSNEELVRRFKNESKAISLLNHPNIVKVFDVSVTDELQYIVMEHIDGITLHDYLAQRPDLTWKEALHFITQLLQALEHAHSKGVVHRDIKPQNIMLLANGAIKVMDFGIARLSQAERSTMTDKAIGSVHYISPEQAKGDVTDRKSDIYSVGVMMYEMLTGRLPFESDTPVGVAIKQISDMPSMPREIRADIPEALEAITVKAMAKSPVDRYQDAGAMLADIEEFKRNPSVHFEYKYFQDQSTKMIDKVVGKELANRSARKTPKKFKITKDNALPIMAGIAAAFAVCAMILIFLIFKMSGNSFFSSREDVELPSFVGMSRQEVEEFLTSGNYKFNITYEEIYNADVEAGQVYDQSPKPPKKVKDNAKITLKVSKGTEIVTIPDVYGNTRRDAEKALVALGLNVSVVPVQDTSYKENTVIRTEPERYTQLNTGDTVTLYIATTQAVTETYVPDVVGQLSLDAAKKILENNGLIVGTISKREDGSPAGTVLEQTPVSGSKVNRGTQVNLTISSGPPPEPEKVTITVTVTFADDIIYGTWASSTGDSFTTSQGGARTWSFSVTAVKGSEDQTISVSGPGSGSVVVKFDGSQNSYGISISSPTQPADPPPDSSDTGGGSSGGGDGGDDGGNSGIQEGSM